MKISLLLLLSISFSIPAICQGITAKEKNGLYGFSASDSMILDFQFDTIHQNLDGSFAVCKQGKWGVVNRVGKEIIPCNYEEVHLFRYRLYAASINGFKGMLDTTGAVVLDFIYDAIDHIETDTQILLKYHGKWCLYKNGQYNFDSGEFLFYFPDIAPSLPGCILDSNNLREYKLCAVEKFHQFISKNIEYPKKARRQGIQGQVLVAFTISREGEIQKPLILQGIGGPCDDEVLRVVQSMPRWNPGKVDSLPVNTFFMYPVSFVLTD